MMSSSHPAVLPSHAAVPGAFEYPADALQQVEALQRQIDALSEELAAMRLRDSTLNNVMERLDEEQRLAARLQRDFLPKSLPRVGSIEFCTLFRPAGYVSGDLYDVMRLDEKNVAFYMADAVGHGMPAALLTMFMKNALVTKEIVPGGYRLLEPNETIGRLNDTIVEQNLSNATFATAVYGRINADTLVMSFARGGHPTPLLLRDGTLQELKSEGALLGIFEKEPFDNCTAQLQKGDKVFVYTDGIEVAFGADHLGDTQKWREELVSRQDEPVSAILDDLGKHIDVDAGSLAPKDDLTVIAITIK